MQWPFNSSNTQAFPLGLDWIETGGTAQTAYHTKYVLRIYNVEAGRWGWVVAEKTGKTSTRVLFSGQDCRERQRAKQRAEIRLQAYLRTLDAEPTANPDER